MTESRLVEPSARLLVMRRRSSARSLTNRACDPVAQRTEPELGLQNLLLTFTCARNSDSAEAPRPGSYGKGSVCECRSLMLRGLYFLWPLRRSRCNARLASWSPFRAAVFRSAFPSFWCSACQSANPRLCTALGSPAVTARRSKAISSEVRFISP